MGRQLCLFKSGESAMTQTIAVITPAWKAEATLVTTVQSVLAQTHADWELWVVADDGADYEAFLAQAGIADPHVSRAES